MDDTVNNKRLQRRIDSEENKIVLREKLPNIVYYIDYHDEDYDGIKFCIGAMHNDSDTPEYKVINIRGGYACCTDGSRLHLYKLYEYMYEGCYKPYSNGARMLLCEIKDANFPEYDHIVKIPIGVKPIKVSISADTAGGLYEFIIKKMPDNLTINPNFLCDIGYGDFYLFFKDFDSIRRNVVLLSGERKTAVIMPIEVDYSSIIVEESDEQIKQDIDEIPF